MKKCSLKQMKRALLGAFAVAILGFATANVNLSLNGKGSFVNFSLKGTVSQANEESSYWPYTRECKQQHDDNEVIWGHGVELIRSYWCQPYSGIEFMCIGGY